MPQHCTALFRVIYRDGSPESIGAFPVTKRETVIDIAEKVLILFNKSSKHRHISVYDLVMVNGITLILTHAGWGKLPDTSLKTILESIKSS